MHPIADRAVLECFYGPLWSTDDRAEVIAAAARHGATSYVYGPSADQRTGAAWREPFAQGALSVEALAAACGEAGLELTWRVSPGAPVAREYAMRAGDPDEVATLERRMTDVVRLGARRILLAFDDLDPALDPMTLTRFGSDPHPIAAAHAAVANRLLEVLGGLGAELLVCPTHYWGVDGSRYRTRIGELLDPALTVCWTGPSIISRGVRADDAARVAEQYQRRIWLWDNFPVNDWHSSVGSGMTNEIVPTRFPLRPLTGREDALADIVVGYGANAALSPRAGLPALVSALAWAAGPEPGAAERAFAAELAVWHVDAGDAAVVADALGSQPLAPHLGELPVAALRYVLGDAASSEELVAALRRLDAAVAALRGHVAGELDPWLDRLATESVAARDAVAVIRHSAGLVDDVDVTAAARRVRAIDLRRTRVVVDGALHVVIERAIGLAGGMAPPWPDAEAVDR